MANKKISQLSSASLPLAGSEPFPVVQSGSTVKATIADVQAAPVAAGTANGVQYLNGSKIPTTGTALIFDGTNLGIGVTPTVNLHVKRTAVDGNKCAILSGYNGFVEINSLRSTGGSYSLLYGTYAGNATDYWAIGSNGYANGEFSIFAGTGTLEALKINAGQDVLAVKGNFVPSTAAKGINFTANTPAAGMTSQLLNWYEEGQYTATVTCGTSGTVSIEPTLHTIFYTRVGRIVHIEGSIRVASVSSPVGYFAINLPFAVASTGSTSSLGTSVIVSYSVSSTANAFSGTCNGGESALRVYLSSGNQLSATSAQQLQAATDILFSFSYAV